MKQSFKYFVETHPKLTEARGYFPFSDFRVYSQEIRIPR